MKDLVYYFDPTVVCHGVCENCVMNRFIIEEKWWLENRYGKSVENLGFAVFTNKNEALNYALDTWGPWAYHVVRQTIEMYEHNNGASE